MAPMEAFRELSDDELVEAATHLQGSEDHRLIQLEMWRRDREHSVDAAATDFYLALTQVQFGARSTDVTAKLAAAIGFLGIAGGVWVLSLTISFSGQKATPAVEGLMVTALVFLWAAVGFLAWALAGVTSLRRSARVVIERVLSMDMSRSARIAQRIAALDAADAAAHATAHGGKGRHPLRRRRTLIRRQTPDKPDGHH